MSRLHRLRGYIRGDVLREEGSRQARPLNIFAASGFFKLGFEEGFEFGEGLGGVVAVGVNGQSAARTGGEHHETHDAFAVHFFAILLDEDVAGKTVGGFDEHGSRTGVDSQFVGDNEVFCH
jgi:hypothetical protein